MTGIGRELLWSITCLEVWICLCLFDDENISDPSCFILHLFLPLFPIYVRFRNQQTLWSQVLDRVSVAYRVLSSFSTLCLYTTKSTKNKIRDLLTSGLKEQYRRGSWNEGDFQKKEQLLAAMNVRSLCVKEASDLQTYQ